MLPLARLPRPSDLASGYPYQSFYRNKALWADEALLVGMKQFGIHSNGWNYALVPNSVLGHIDEGRHLSAGAHLPQEGMRSIGILVYHIPIRMCWWALCWRKGM